MKGPIYLIMNMQEHITWAGQICLQIQWIVQIIGEKYLSLSVLGAQSHHYHGPLHAIVLILLSSFNSIGNIRISDALDNSASYLILNTNKAPLLWRNRNYLKRKDIYKKLADFKTTGDFIWTEPWHVKLWSKYYFIFIKEWAKANKLLMQAIQITTVQLVILIIANS